MEISVFTHGCFKPDKVFGGLNWPHNARLDFTERECVMPTFFETACLEGQIEDVKFFLDKGHPVNKRDANGLTPIMLAASMGHMSVCLLLLRHGADVDLLNDKQQTAAMLAQQGGFLMLAKLLCGKSERRQKRRSGQISLNQTDSTRLADLLSYGLSRGFLSDVQIYAFLPSLRTKPKRFALVCQALKATGIVLRDREPEIALANAAQPKVQLNKPDDLQAYADKIIVQINSPLAMPLGLLQSKQVSLDGSRRF